jgi:hypothetical protein
MTKKYKKKIKILGPGKKRGKKRKLGRIEKNILKKALNKALNKPEPTTTPFTAQVKLGAIAFESMDAQEAFAKKLADKLKVAIAANMWVQPYEDKEYVRVEGWTMLGAFIGVTPVENYCKEIPVSNEDHTMRGFEAQVSLLCNGTIVGGASAQCTLEEAEWAGKDSFALRSMTITRATSKAFRLNYGWIMAMTGYDPSPAAELINPEKKIKLDPAKQQPMTTGNATPKGGTLEFAARVFGVWPPAHNGNKFFIFAVGDQLTDKGTPGIEAYLQQEFHAVFTDKFHSKGGWLIPETHLEAVRKYLRDKMIAAQIPQYAQATSKAAAQ